MGRRRILGRPMVLLSILVGVTACSQQPAIDWFTISGEPRPLPTAQLAPVDAKGFQRMLVGLRGKPVIVNIWASWCVPCRAEAPILRRAADETSGDVVFLGIDAKDGPEAARSFLEEFSITYPNVSDESGEIPQYVGLRGYPTTIAIDRTGTVRGSSFGGLTESRLAALISEIR